MKHSTQHIEIVRVILSPLFFLLLLLTSSHQYVCEGVCGPKMLGNYNAKASVAAGELVCWAIL